MQRQTARLEFVRLEKAPPKSRPRCAAKLRLFRVFKLLGGLKAVPPVERTKWVAASARRARWTGSIMTGHQRR